ncbi:MAG: glycoside hydrolase family 88 protein [Lachnospiraceae bacterium]|nr:glycoside hydrolase family 88 protein [Lachnospiraceae bacterium]
MSYELLEEDRRWVKETSFLIQKKLEWVSEKNQNKLPYTTGPDGSYDDHSDGTYGVGEDESWWTNGFWGGLMWQMYRRTGQEKYARYAGNCEKKLDACFEAFCGLNHDVGFMWLPTSVASYRVRGNAESRKRALHAACLLAGRYHPEGKFIRAWNEIPGEDTRGWAIIDCMMNLPLLYWATEETGDLRFHQIAMNHADTARSAFLREDGSSCHIVSFDPETGKRRESLGGQGYGHGSAWTRGQGWALYGFALSYRHTGKPDYLLAAKASAQYCLSQIGTNGFVPIDFRQPVNPPLEDSCGACVLACGFLELAELVTEPELSEKYLDAALCILKRLTACRCDWSGNCDAIVQNCSASYVNGVHITMCYADYFLAEAIFRLEGKALSIF